MKTSKIYIVMIREFEGWRVIAITERVAFAQSTFVKIPRNTRVATGAIVKFKAGKGMVQGIFGPEADANSEREECFAKQQFGKIFPPCTPKDPAYETFKAEIVTAARAFLPA